MNSKSQHCSFIIHWILGNIEEVLLYDRNQPFVISLSYTKPKVCFSIGAKCFSVSEKYMPLVAICLPQLGAAQLASHLLRHQWRSLFFLNKSLSVFQSFSLCWSNSLRHAILEEKLRMNLPRKIIISMALGTPSLWGRHVQNDQLLGCLPRRWCLWHQTGIFFLFSFTPLSWTLCWKISSLIMLCFIYICSSAFQTIYYGLHRPVEDTILYNSVPSPFFLTVSPVPLHCLLIQCYVFTVYLIDLLDLS